MQLEEGLSPKNNRPLIVAALGVGLLIFLMGLFLSALLPFAGEQKVFTLESGMGFRDVADRLAAENLVKSSLATKFYMLISGSAFGLQPGVYLLSSSLGAVRKEAQDAKESILKSVSKEEYIEKASKKIKDLYRRAGIEINI